MRWIVGALGISACSAFAAGWTVGGRMDDSHLAAAGGRAAELQLASPWLSAGPPPFVADDQLALPPGHPPLEAYPALPPGHPPLRGREAPAAGGACPYQEWIIQHGDMFEGGTEPAAGPVIST